MKNVLKQEKQIRLKRTKIKNTKSKSMIILSEKYRYEFQKSILKDRNSYSKTDHDATFMRMKRRSHEKMDNLSQGIIYK